MGADGGLKAMGAEAAAPDPAAPASAPGLIHSIKMKTQFLPALGLALLAAGLPARAGNTVTDWNDLMLQAIRNDATTPPRASCNMAIVQTAVFDAVNAVGRSYQPYHYTALAAPGTSADAAANAAAYHTLVSLYPAQQAMFASAYAAKLAAIPDGFAKASGLALGQTVAGSMLTLRSADGSGAVVHYTPGTAPGAWRPTAPAYAPALLPQWPGVTPFAMTSGSQFRPSGPPSLTSAKYAADFNLTKEIGAKFSATRTVDQTEIASFWADGAGTATPPGHWNAIAQQVINTGGLSLEDSARLLALVNIAAADACIVAWDAKYQDNFWRPITAIWEAGTDGNPLTDADTSWLPLLITPPFPEYTSGHSTFSGASAEILALLNGSDGFSFTIGSDGMPGVMRSFSSFSEAADEAGLSRIYGGIHFMAANEDGLAAGRSLGEYVFNNFLQPVPEPTTTALFALGMGLLLCQRRSTTVRSR